jgi:ABC-type Fe3+-hydroxamate transport system substrate-binding protein
LKPDLILGTREGNPPWVIEKFKRLNLEVHYFVRPKTFNNLLNNFLALAHILEKAEQGKNIVSDVENTLGKLKRGVGYRVLWQVGADPLIVASQVSFANDVIRFAGGVNIVETEMPYPRMSMEEVILKKPQLIVLTDMGYNVGMEMKRWKKYMKDIHFVIMDSYIVGSPTPVTFLEAVRKLSETMKNVE